MSQRALFPAASANFATGYRYQSEFLTQEEESVLLGHIRELPLRQAEYKQFLAHRRILSFGGRYDFTAQRLQEGAPIPSFLLPLRARIGAWAGRAPECFTHALIAEYAPGVQLGWHRDVPDFELVIGVSLLSACRMRFRRYPAQPRAKSIAIELEPRSIYCLQDEARWGWQHSVPPVASPRYSITFRTLRVEP